MIATSVTLAALMGIGIAAANAGTPSDRATGDDTGRLEISTTDTQVGVGTVQATQVFSSPGTPEQTLGRAFRWNGSGFLPLEPAPHPLVHVAP